jgi:hypothetical protein
LRTLKYGGGGGVGVENGILGFKESGLSGVRFNKGKL